MAAEVDYEITGADSELGEAPELETKVVVFPKWLNKRKKATAFVMHELTHGEHETFELSDRVWDKLGNAIRFKVGGKDYRWLQATTRDGDGNHVWATAEACEKRLKPLGRSITNKMIAAANKVNYGDAISAEEAESSAEGKSEET